jgi:hypothetical protein
MQFLMWSEVILIWSVVAYGMGHDPLHGETPPKFWLVKLAVRSAAAGVAAFWLSHSALLSVWILLSVGLLAAARYYLVRPILMATLPASIANLLAVGIAIWHFRITPGAGFDWFLEPQKLAALCVTLSLLLFVARGGAYFVAELLQCIGPKQVEKTALRRGYTIGILERLILSIVVAFGSFEALAFLVAAKGLIRGQEFQGANSRDFTEYFIAGTLISVLMAVCVGLIIRFTLMHAWPDILTLRLSPAA